MDRSLGRTGKYIFLSVLAGVKATTLFVFEISTMKGRALDEEVVADMTRRFPAMDFYPVFQDWSPDDREVLVTFRLYREDTEFMSPSYVVATPTGRILRTYENKTGSLDTKWWGVGGRD